MIQPSVVHEPAKSRNCLYLVFEKINTEIKNKQEKKTKTKIETNKIITEMKVSI